MPQLSGREFGAGCQRFELGPCDLRMNAAAETAIGAGDDVHAADHFGVTHNPVCHHLRVLDDVGRVAHDAGNEQLAVRQPHIPPDAPFMLVPRIAGLVLQIDDPSLPDNWDMINPEPPLAEFKKFERVRMEALNHALRGLPTDRILTFARVVGRENVIAGTDCGLGGRIHPQLVWAKLAALVEGAKLATKDLYGS